MPPRPVEPAPPSNELKKTLPPTPDAPPAQPKAPAPEPVLPETPTAEPADEPAPPATQTEKPEGPGVDALDGVAGQKPAQRSLPGQRDEEHRPEKVATRPAVTRPKGLDVSKAAEEEEAAAEQEADLSQLGFGRQTAGKTDAPTGEKEAEPGEAKPKGKAPEEPSSRQKDQLRQSPVPMYRVLFVLRIIGSNLSEVPDTAASILEATDPAAAEAPLEAVPADAATEVKR